MIVLWWGATWDNGKTRVSFASIKGHGWRGALADVHGDLPGQWPAELAEFALDALQAGLRALEEAPLFQAAYCGACNEVRPLFRNPRGAVARCAECLEAGR